MSTQQLGAPQATHPTVNYGLPGGQQAQILPSEQSQGIQPLPLQRQSYGYTQYAPENIPPAPQQGQFMQQPALPGMQPQQPQYQGYVGGPVQQVPQGQQQQWQGYAQPGQQFQQAPQQPRANITGDFILDGPSVPAHQRGRTLSQILQMNDALAADFLQRNPRQQQQPPQLQPPPQRGQFAQPQQQFQQQPQQQQRQQQQAPQGQAWDWSNPAGSVSQVLADTLPGMLQQTLGPMLQPVVQRGQATDIAQARNVAMSGVPDFQQLEGGIMEILKGADAESLSNPDVWIGAADLARGKQARMGGGFSGFNAYGAPQYQNPGQGYTQPQQPQQGGYYAQPQNGSYMQPQQPQAQQQQPWGQPQAQPRVVPANQPQQFQFFAEGPNAVNGYQGGGLSAEMLDAARKFGMDPQTYAAWRGGVQR